MFPTQRVLGAVLALAVGVGLVAACDNPAGQSKAQPAAPPPPEVGVAILAASEVPLDFEYAGRVAGVREVEVRARAPGILVKRTYVEGERVKEGDQLFQIDPAPLQATLAQAKAQLGQEQARLSQAQTNWARVSPLYERGFASRRDRDEALSALNLAKAGVAAAEAQIQTAEINLGYTKVTAPVSGITSLERVSEGSLVGTGPTDSLLTRITQIDPVYVNFAVPDAEAAFIRQAIDQGHIKSANGRELSLEVRASQDTGEVHTGVVDFTGSTVDVATGTVRSRATVPNPKFGLLPGQFVRIRVKGIVQPNAIVIPTAALMQGPQGAFVFQLAENNVVQVRPIKLGRELDQGWVVEDGLKPGDRIISDGVIKARPGQPVRVAEAAPASAAPAGGQQNSTPGATR
jgi:membrane fusion protein, multidrug efflux system